jgi:hypothetical protein
MIRAGGRAEDIHQEVLRAALDITHSPAELAMHAYHGLSSAAPHADFAHACWHLFPWAKYKPVDLCCDSLFVVWQGLY